MVEDTRQIIEDAPTSAELWKQSRVANSFGQKKVEYVHHSTISIYFEPVSKVGKGYGFDYEIPGIKEKKLYYAFLMPHVPVDVNDKFLVDGVEYVVYDVNRFPDHIDVFLVKEKRVNL